MAKLTLGWAIITVVVLGWAIGCDRSATPTPVDAPPGTVTVVIELPSGPSTHAIENVTAGTTLAEVMKQIDAPEIVTTGSGTSTLVESIGGVANAGLKGWTFRVDETFATEGIGSVKLTPPTTIRWRHGTFDEAM